MGTGTTKPPLQYAVAHLRESLAEDPRCNELDIEIDQAGDRILLRGEVVQPDRRETVERIAREKFPDCTIDNQIRILNLSKSTETEDVK